MIKKMRLLVLLLAFVCVWAVPDQNVYAAEPIVIGVPTSLGFLEGKESHKAVQMAVGEINAKGGVMVGGQKRPFKVFAADLRDAAPGVPVPEALLGLEKLILEKKPTAILVGPFRSEALLAGMDIFAKYKMPLLGTVAMSPGTEAKIKKEPEKYKYIFRVSLNVIYWVKLLAGTNVALKNEFGFDKVYIMNQDVAWARGTAGGMEKKVYPKLGIEVVGHDQFPTGFSDFSSALMKAKAKGAGILFTCFDMPESGVLVKQWKSLKVPALIAGFISPMAGEVAWKSFNGKIGGLMNAIFELGNIPSKKYAPAKKFYDTYKKTYGKGIQSGHGPAPSYESVYILKEAIERAGSLDPDAIVAEIEKTDRKGVMGRIRFDEGHQVIYGTDPAETAVGAFFQWTDDGKRKIVYPKSLAEGEITLPSWVKKR
ncbi:MAG: ABC transporter substrate-binding protein [Deltaproteobacteria bacterium]|nr:ABC transporter substrate-binding protein [Deltaproteobacteria bacterium]